MKFVKTDESAKNQGYTTLACGIIGFKDGVDRTKLMEKFDNVNCVCKIDKNSFTIYTSNDINRKKAKSINDKWLKELINNN